MRINVRTCKEKLREAINEVQQTLEIAVDKEFYPEACKLRDARNLLTDYLNLDDREFVDALYDLRDMVDYLDVELTPIERKVRGLE